MFPDFWNNDEDPEYGLCFIIVICIFHYYYFIFLCYLFSIFNHFLILQQIKSREMDL